MMSSITHDGADHSVLSVDTPNHERTEVNENPRCLKEFFASLTNIKKDFVVKVVYSERFLWVLGLTAISLDPWFFYVPIVKGGSICIGLDKMLMIGVVILRTFVDILHDWSWWYKSLSDEISPVGGGSVALTRLKDLFKWLRNCRIASPHGRSSIPSRAIAVIASLPLPQMVVLTIDLRSRFKTWLKVVILGQLAPRIFRTYPAFVATTTNSRIHIWIGAAFNFLLYVYASHALGSFWYIRAIDRQIHCMKEACRDHSGCSESSLYCESGNYADNGFIQEICTTNPKNATTPFDYGIYIGAVKSNLIGSTSLIVKLVDGFWWGLNSLSTMGQDLELTDYIWDTCFAILTCILGLVLFAVLIGNLQMYLQSKMPLKVKKMKEKIEELEKWPLYSSLSDELKHKVSMCQHSHWQNGTGVNLECLFNNIPSELEKKLKSHFCNNLFDKVKGFERLEENVQKILRDRAKPTTFPARTEIQRKGHPIHEIIHIVHGKVLAYNNGDVNEGLSVKELKENDCFGKSCFKMPQRMISQLQQKPFNL